MVQVSQRELERFKILVELGEGRLGIDAAATLLGVERRQLFRLRNALQGQGAAGLVSRKRGRPSNRAHGAPLRSTAIGLVRDRYADFGPTLAAEKLLELHGLPLGVETLRQWMIADGLWMRRKDRRQRVFQPRPRRDCLGELVQIDGSEHWWFEGRGPQCTLLVFIDDATSRLMELRLVETEAAFGYFQSTRAYLAAHGKPVTFYSDKHSIFRISKADAVQGRGMTQFGRALHDLNIDILCADTPQAKGRVERANKTLQDRLVKEFRLQGICSIEAGNAALPAFMAAYNVRFAKVAGNARDMHRPVASTDDLDTAFSWQEERTVSCSLTLQYEKVLFLLRPGELTRSLARKRVTVHDFGVVQIRVTPKTRNPFTIKALLISGVTWKWHFLNHARNLGEFIVLGGDDVPFDGAGGLHGGGFGHHVAVGGREGHNAHARRLSERVEEVALQRRLERAACGADKEGGFEGGRRRGRREG